MLLPSKLKMLHYTRHIVEVCPQKRCDKLTCSSIDGSDHPPSAAHCKCFTDQTGSVMRTRMRIHECVCAGAELRPTYAGVHVHVQVHIVNGLVSNYPVRRVRQMRINRRRTKTPHVHEIWTAKKAWIRLHVPSLTIHLYFVKIPQMSFQSSLNKQQNLITSNPIQSSLFCDLW